MKIFIVEDEAVLRQELVKLLNGYGYQCSFIEDNFQNAVEKVMEDCPDLVLLDINLPTVDGYHICREIRKKSQVPVIIVTSRNTDMDELMGINLGADNFITKPYNSQILLARIEAVLKRTCGNGSSDILEYKGLQVLLGKSAFSYGGRVEELTKNELKILTILIKNSGSIVSRDELMEELWQSDEFVDDNTLTVNVNRVRRKLQEAGAEGFIATKRGQGYMI